MERQKRSTYVVYKHEVEFVNTGRKYKQNKAILKLLVVVDYNQANMGIVRIYD